MNFISKIFFGFIDLLFYGNFWIALCALSLFWQTEWILTTDIQFDDLAAFVFSSTLFLYAAHRIVGLRRVQKFTNKGRYLVIQKFRIHIFAYAFLGGVGAAYFFFQLPTNLQLIVIAPSLLSLGYVIPLFGKDRRLRDFSFIKIFLVAIVWAWVTVALPWFQIHDTFSSEAVLMFLERTLFIFAITIPFDIRDLRVDKDTNVNTIPSRIGIRKSLYLSYAALCFMIIISSYLFATGLYSVSVYYGILLSFLTTSILVYLTPRQDHDYFFTGAMDGTMMLQFLFVVLLSFFMF